MHKKYVRGDYANYRPVSIVPIISQVLEILLNNQVMKHFEINCLLPNSQYGFRPERSTSRPMAKKWLSYIVNIMK